jgi:hypothetical protein
MIYENLKVETPHRSNASQIRRRVEMMWAHRRIRAIPAGSLSIAYFYLPRRRLRDGAFGLDRTLLGEI